MSGKTAPAGGPACPICGKPAQAETKPFCSPRCADVDLGRWLGERYAIPTPLDDDARPPPEDEDDGAR
ncbi:DNA gyrase inhibitor YacG [Methylobacterium sp. Leaf118]|uniref:DNA gyrase inhibitor YacG n=1 Tax=Methylobacterium sp. Leaf118 TaxID=2876562 RepID=UPI001E4D2912|nr:DNA gyrase inhibitor YacG [Methylobacterium sp. Leaf118]